MMRERKKRPSVGVPPDVERQRRIAAELSEAAESLKREVEENDRIRTEAENLEITARRRLTEIEQRWWQEKRRVAEIRRQKSHFNDDLRREIERREEQLRKLQIDVDTCSKEVDGFMELMRRQEEDYKVKLERFERQNQLDIQGVRELVRQNCREISQVGRHASLSSSINQNHSLANIVERQSDGLT